MNDSDSVNQQSFSEYKVGVCNYLATDGLVKYCRTAPLLDLPVDFQEWFEPNRTVQQPN